MAWYNYIAEMPSSSVNVPWLNAVGSNISHSFTGAPSGSWKLSQVIPMSPVTSDGEGTVMCYFVANPTPSDLFSNNEQGFWYDPSDLSTLFQTADGTPVTTLGQPVGFVLDKRLGGGTLGSNVISGGTFDTASLWTTGSGWTISGGVATKTAGTASILSQTISPVSGQRYILRYVLTRTSGSIAPIITASGIPPTIGVSRSGSGTYVEYLTAPVVTGSTPVFLFSADANFAGTVDNVTLRAVPPGNHAFQSIAASRPTLQARSNLLTGTTTLATQTVTVLAAQHTLSFTGTGTVTLSGVSTAGPLVGTGVGQRVSLTFIPTAGNLTLTVSGTVTDAQLELGSAVTTYQRVTTATDYADIGLPRNLTFDGVDDFLTCDGLLDGTSYFEGANAPFTMFAGTFRQTSSIAHSVMGMWGNTNATAANNDGMFFILRGVTTQVQATTRDFDGATNTVKSVFAGTNEAPKFNVITWSRTATSGSIRVNGVSGTPDDLTQPALNLALATVGAQRRGAGTPTPIDYLNGRIHQLVLVGADEDLDTIQKMEQFIAEKTGVSI